MLASTDSLVVLEQVHKMSEVLCQMSNVCQHKAKVLLFQKAFESMQMISQPESFFDGPGLQ